MSLFGVLNIDKPTGPTSREAVDRVVRCVRPTKVGHAGTLDPIARGVLVVCLGPATRLIQFVQRMPKTYTAEFQLGVRSPTDDVESATAPLIDPPRPTLAAIQAACQQFVGQIPQRPPDFSAAKVRGQRAYALARKGASFELPPREVVVHSLAVVRYEYPQLELEITCGSGTYIRSLGRDLADNLGTAAVMTALCRTAIGHFRQCDALPIDEVSADSIAGCLQPATSAVSELPQRVLSESEVLRLARGQSIRDAAAGGQPTEEEIAGVDSQGELVALLVRRDAEALRPRKNFPRPSVSQQAHPCPNS